MNTLAIPRTAADMDEKLRHFKAARPEQTGVDMHKRPHFTCCCGYLWLVRPDHVHGQPLTIFMRPLTM
jgi:hypothetical protein